MAGYTSHIGKIISFVIIISLLSILGIDILIVGEENYNDAMSTRISGDLDVFEPDWCQTYGYGYYDFGRGISQCTDGGYIIVGSTTHNGSTSTRLWLIRTDSRGNEVWNRTFGGDRDDYGYCVKQTTDGGFIISGNTYSYGEGRMDAWLIKTDNNGNEEWNRTFGWEEDEWGFDVIQTSDDGFLIASATQSFGVSHYTDGLLIKTDNEGNEEWNRTFRGGTHISLDDVKQTGNGDYVLLGRTNAYGNGEDDIWVIKLNRSGSELWNMTYGGRDNETGYSIIPLSSGGFIITGATNSIESGGKGPWLIRINDTGVKEWDVVFDGFESYNVFVQESSDGGFFLAGNIEDRKTGNVDLLLLKTNATGRELWRRKFGGSRVDATENFIKTSDGGFAILGRTESFGAGFPDILLVKIDSGGGGISKNKAPHCIITNPVHGHKYSGSITINGNAWDIEGDWDTDDDVERVEVRIDNAPWKEASFHWRTNIWTYILYTEFLENGKHTIYARSFDGELYSDYENNSIEIFIDNADTVGSADEFFEKIGRLFFIICLIMVSAIVIVFMIALYFILKRRDKSI